MINKKVIVLLIVMMLGVTGCGTSVGNSTSEIENEKETTESSKESSNEAHESRGVKIPNFNTTATIEETILIDQDDIKVTATELIYTDYSVDVKLMIENNSSKDLSFIAGSLGYSSNSVNGYMIADGYLNEDVAAGKKANDSISISITELQMYGINEIADIQLGIYTTDSDYNSTYYEPAKIETNLATSHDYNADYYEDTVSSGLWETIAKCSVDYWNIAEYYNNEGILIKSATLITNIDGDKSLFLEAKNTMDQRINVSLSNIAINGLVVSSGTWTTNSINTGATAIVDIDLSNLIDKNYYEALNIDGVDSLSFDFGLDDGNTERIEIAISGSDVIYTASGNSVYESNVVKLAYVGTIIDESDYSDDYCLLYIVENETTEEISVRCAYDSLAINGFMVDFSSYSKVVPAEGKALMTIEVDEDSLADAGISSIDELGEVEFLLEVKNSNYKTILEETITH